MRQQDREDERGGRGTLVTALGWFSVGLGAAQLLAPKQVARLAGLPTKGRASSTRMRLFGARELMSGVGILRQRRPSRWLMARVAGDLVDLSALGMALFAPARRFRRRTSTRLTTALVSVAAVTALDVLGYRATTRGGRLAQRPREAPPELKAALTIGRSAQDLYAFWRDVENLPRFMTHVSSVEGIDERRSRWTMKIPGAPTASWEATIVDDRPGELIGWRTEGAFAQVMEGGQVSFRAAPGGQGTEVHVVLRTAGATLPSALRRWLKKLPQRWLAHELRLFKQLMELGEIPKAQSRFTDESHTIVAGTAGHELPRPFTGTGTGADTDTGTGRGVTS